MARVINLENFSQAPGGRGGQSYDAPTPLPNLAAKQLEQSAQVLDQNSRLLQATLLDIQTKKNEAQVKEADVELAEKMRNLLNDPKTGYLNSQGKNAVDARESTEKAIDEALREMEGRFTSPETKRMWSDASQARRSNAISQIMGHAAKETNVYRVQSGAARIESAMQDAAANWKDADARSVAKATMLAEVSELAQLKGFDADQTKQANIDATTAFHTQIMSAMLAQDQTTAAEEYLTANEKEIDATKVSAIREKLQTASLKRQSIDLSDKLLETVPGIEGQLAQVKDLYKQGKVSPELRDATEQRLWASWQDDQRLDAEADRQAREELQGIELATGENMAPIDQGGVRGLLTTLFPGVQITSGARSPNHPLSIKNPGSYHNTKNGGFAIDVRKIPGVSFNEFVGKLRGAGLNVVEAIDEYKNPSKNATGGHWHIAWKGARATPKGNAPSIKTNPQLYSDLLAAAADDPTGFAQGFSVEAFSSELSPTDLKYFAEKADAIRRGNTKAMEGLASYRAGLKALIPDIKAAGIDVKDGSLAKFTNAFQKEVEKEEAKVKRPLTLKEATAVGRGLLAEGYIEQDYWRDKSVRRYEVAPRELDRFYTKGGTSRASRTVPYAQIPAAKRERLISEWQKYNPGRQPSRRDIEATYVRFRERGLMK